MAHTNPFLSRYEERLDQLLSINYSPLLLMRNMCKGETSTSTLDQLLSATRKDHNKTLEEVILDLELEGFAMGDEWKLQLQFKIKEDRSCSKVIENTIQMWNLAVYPPHIKTYTTSRLKSSSCYLGISLRSWNCPQQRRIRWSPF